MGSVGQGQALPTRRKVGSQGEVKAWRSAGAQGTRGWRGGAGRPAEILNHRATRQGGSSSSYFIVCTFLWHLKIEVHLT